MEATKAPESLLDKFVFMDKALKILDVGLKTEKNVILYGPGGHGKSELTLEFFYEKQINPYIITMGTGMTTDRLFGGINIPAFEKEGKLEYLIENSFMNHEYVIFEEMMDAPDFILEQLKDILSSGIFRNGTQVYPIKTRFIVCCTNRTREEFSKNDSLRALMERFPLELNVIWDNYTEISYNTLLGKRYGVGQVDPIIPFILHEYVKNGITISPRIALDSYQIYEECGPESLHFIAEFAKKPALIVDALKKFQSVIKFKEVGSEIEEIMSRITENSRRSTLRAQEYVDDFKVLNDKYQTIRKMKVDDDMIHVHSELSGKIGQFIDDNRQKLNNTVAKIQNASVPAPPERYSSTGERNVFDEGRAKRQAEAVTKAIFDEITDDSNPF
jgi:hypothetical protein